MNLQTARAFLARRPTTPTHTTLAVLLGDQLLGAVRPLPYRWEHEEADAWR
jgi:hypothetical protein